jgi:hypothetical protein
MEFRSQESEFRSLLTKGKNPRSPLWRPSPAENDRLFSRPGVLALLRDLWRPSCETHSAMREARFILLMSVWEYAKKGSVKGSVNNS